MKLSAITRVAWVRGPIGKKCAYQVDDRCPTRSSACWSGLCGSVGWQSFTRGMGAVA
jgi:hypothetical protein